MWAEGHYIQFAEGLGLHRKILLARAVWSELNRTLHRLAGGTAHEELRFITDIFD